jgi:hypothetical protein
MIGRRPAVALALLLALTLLLTVAVESARGLVRNSSEIRPKFEPRVVTAIRQEFGTGWLGDCFTAIAWRESRYHARAANWTDRHADGSRGSFGALGIGALWRRPGESVSAFAARMYDPAANAALAHRIYRRYGLQPWGSCQ